jgi:hypothetical protein
MLTQQLLDKLRELRLESMAKALQEQMESDLFDALSFSDRLGLLVDREMMHRENKRLV